MFRTFNILLALLITLNFVSAQSPASRTKFTSKGYWIHDKVEEIPGLKTGPFVRLGNGDILTVEGN